MKIPSPFSFTLRTKQFENAVIANLNSVSRASVPFYNQLFGIWNATPGAARAQNTLAGGGCSNVTNLAGSPFEAPNPCPTPLQSAPLQPPTTYFILDRFA